VADDEGHERSSSNPSSTSTALAARATRTTGSAHAATLRRIDDAPRIAKRYVYLEQTVLLSRNLTNLV
jgi:hypothetical protein